MQPRGRKNARKNSAKMLSFVIICYHFYDNKKNDEILIFGAFFKVFFGRQK
jgi:hypothetical protein